MWVGLVLALLCLSFELLGGITEAFVWLFSMLGSCYWFFCVHRIHKVLAEYTTCAYPISARKAVGFQIIPLFEYYWFFRWTRQIAKFLDQQAGRTTAPKLWPGVLLVGASVLGWFPLFKSVRLFLFFGFGLYLIRQLKAVLPPARPLRVRRAQQWNLSMSAGVGAAFSFVLVQALRDFSTQGSKEKLHELAAIFLVSVGVLIFLEPLFDRLRLVLGIEHHHTAVHKNQSWVLRLSVFAILVFTSLFHGLLHTEIENSIDHDWIGTLTMLLTGLLVSGGITYFWIAAAHRRPSHAARSGLISGAVFGFLVASAVLAVANPSAGSGESNQQLLTQAFHHEFPLVPARVLKEMEEGKLGNDSGLTQMGIIAFPWPIFGLMGGLAIDKRWGGGKVHGVALSMFAAAILYGGFLLVIRRLSGLDLLSHLSVAAGWGLALIVCSSSKILIPEEATEVGIQAEAVPVVA
jgi:hypothetical protein